MGDAYELKRAGGGTIRVTAGDDGTIAVVDVVLPASKSGTIDLPGAKAFPLSGSQQSYESMSSYVQSDNCVASTNAAPCYAYTLEDGELVLTFGPSGSGLHEAVWGDRALLKQLGLIVAGTTL